MIYNNLNSGKALIWRIVHRDNLPWILDNGLHCSNSSLLAPNYINIGNSELIDKRRTRVVRIAPGGTLADYVPFYFTPFSVMMKNIHSGRGVRQRKNEEIVILVSSLGHLIEQGLPFLFTDAHAYPRWTNYYDSLDHINEIDWQLLQHRDFRRDADDPRKMERYQAEALVANYVPISGILGIICYTEEVKAAISQQLSARALALPVHVRPGWYF